MPGLSDRAASRQINSVGLATQTRVMPPSMERTLMPLHSRDGGMIGRPSATVIV